MSTGPGVLAVFARYPAAGAAKTRLTPALGAAGAARACEQFTRDLLARLAAAGYACRVYGTGAPPESFARCFGDAHRYREQQGKDLGERMYDCLLRESAGGEIPVLLIGSDAPDLPLAHLVEGFAALAAGADLVLGPAADGGYYLIGTSRPRRELFTGIAWGTDRVLTQTQQVAAQLGLTVHLLPIWRDIDTPDDYDAYRQRRAAAVAAR